MGIIFVFQDIGVSQSPLLRCLAKPLAWMFGEASYVGALQKPFFGCFASPWGLHKVPYLMASWVPLIQCFAKHLATLWSLFLRNLGKPLAWVLHKTPYLWILLSPLLRCCFVKPLACVLHEGPSLGGSQSSLLTDFMKSSAWVPVKPIPWVLHKTSCLCASWSMRLCKVSYIAPRGFPKTVGTLVQK